MRRALEIFASRAVTLALFVSAALTYVTYLVLSGGQLITLTQGVDVLAGGSDVPHLIATSRVWAAFVAVLIAHVLALIVVRVLRSLEDPDPEAVTAEDILARTGSYTVVTPAPAWVEGAQGVLTETWYAQSEDQDRAVFWTSRHVIARDAWRFAVWLLVVAAFVSMLTREAAYVNLGDGQLVQAPVKGQMYRYDWRFPAKQDVAIDGDALGIVQGSIRPGLDAAMKPAPQGFLARPATADVVLGNPAEAAVKVGMWPPAVIHGRFVSITEMGIAPHLVITRGDQTLSDKYATTAIMPGGQNIDRVQPESFGYMVEFTALPGPLVPNGTYNAVVVGPGGSEIASGLVGAGASLVVSDTVIAVPDTQWWVGLSVVKDPGVWIGLVALVLLVVAIGLRAWVAFEGWERYSFALAATEHGPRLYIGVDASLFARRRAEARLRELARMLDRARTQERG